ncbi:hypothetical protein [Cobetia crustatorum]|uniref:Uncharacterized protein n=1 Tax=Cobetia crustatorum TaxID=553385 RepID=A0A558HLK2_9GAMM|nr:hypothetical protein [Cobetia crustatorum]TVU70002.1 hypothetical protein FQP86_09285 [Cobetia crustatorum]
MINLNKPDQTATIDLTKGSSDLLVRAQWVDNGDDKDNDDLDLRCSILMPDEQMYLIDGAYPCSLDDVPYARHHGDVQGASTEMPGEEQITVARDIAKRMGGPVALCFSVYSAVANGAVAVATLKPRMKMSFGSQEVVCDYDFTQNADANVDGVYTYIIGYAIVTEDEVILAPSGKTSRPGQEETAWPAWHGTSIDVDISGPAVFKGAQANYAAKYNAKKRIERHFANVPQQATKKGLFGKLFS